MGVNFLTQVTTERHRVFQSVNN